MVRRPALYLVIATSGLVLGACRQEPLAPPSDVVAVTETGPVMQAHRSSRWRFNRDKYSDRGRRRGHGRSGSAVLTAEVLVGADGRASLEATSYRAGDPETPRGSIETMLIKIQGPGGRPLAVRHYDTRGNTVIIALPHLPAGAVVHVFALVRGIDGRRTDVVSVTGIVPSLRPDIAVTRIVAPQTAVAGTPTVIGAVLTELGGQHGARVNCDLYVNGTLADQARDIWVDAGDVVSCAFTRVFMAGAAQLRVVAAEVRPGDGAPANNIAELALTVAEPALSTGEASFSGDVRSGTFASADTFETRWTASDGSLFLEQRNDSRASGTLQTVNVSGTIARQLGFPLARIELAENADGRLVRTTRLDDVQPTAVSPGANCYADDDGSGVAVYLCAYDVGFTSISFVRNAGTVTYQSSEYSKMWNGASYDENTYVVNPTTTTVPTVAMMSHYAVNVRVVAGGVQYAFDGAASLMPVSDSDIQPRQCVTVQIPLPPEVYTATQCFASAYVFTGVGGTMAGEGVITVP